MNRRTAACISQLRAVALFRGCSDKELEHIDSLGCRNDVERGTVLCRQGRIGRQAFVVLDGEATVAIDGVDVATIGPGSFFGEMSVLDGAPRVGTVTASTSMTVLVFAPHELEALLSHGRIARRMLGTVTARLRQADGFAFTGS